MVAIVTHPAPNNWGIVSMGFSELDRMAKKFRREFAGVIALPQQQLLVEVMNGKQMHLSVGNGKLTKEGKKSMDLMIDRVRLANSLKLGKIGGSDGHTTREFSSALTIFHSRASRGFSVDDMMEMLSRREATPFNPRLWNLVRRGAVDLEGVNWE